MVVVVKVVRKIKGRAEKSCVGAKSRKGRKGRKSKIVNSKFLKRQVSK